MKAFSNLASIAYPLLYRNHPMPLKKTNVDLNAYHLETGICKATQSWGP